MLVSVPTTAADDARSLDLFTSCPRFLGGSGGDRSAEKTRASTPALNPTPSRQGPTPTRRKREQRDLMNFNQEMANLMVNRPQLRKKIKEKKGTSGPVTAEAIGSGCAALVG